MPRHPGRNKLALVGGFVKPREDLAQGTLQSSYLICQELAATGGYDELHVYQEHQREIKKGVVTLPAAPPSRLFEKAALAVSRESYSAIYAANGEHLWSCPFVLRPQHDWAPMICSVGATHIAGQWSNLLVGLASGALRRHDGFIFKSQRAREVFLAVWADWTQRFGFSLPPPAHTEVIRNGVDTQMNWRDDRLRWWTRRRLHLRDDDVVFLAFCRVNDGTKGDHMALVVRWRQVLQRLPNAVLVVAGGAVDRLHVAELRSTARSAGIADRVIVIENPSEEFANARQCLMSAADVFLHLSTGVEEASPMVVSEAQAHGLPVIATDWAGAGEVVEEGVTGYLVATQPLPVPEPHRSTLFALAPYPQGAPPARSVVCDFPAVVTHAIALGDPERRARLGANARATSEARDLRNMTARYVAFFDEVSVEAEKAWPHPSYFRPLVDIDLVLRTQAAGALRADRRVRLGDMAALVVLTAGTSSEDPRGIAAVLAACKGGPRLLGEVAERVAVAVGAAPGEPLRAFSPLLARMLNYGVIELEADAGEKMS